MLRRTARLVFGAAALAAAPLALADLPDELHSLSQRWASARYEHAGEQRKRELAALANDADEILRKYPDQAGSHIWAAIMRCSRAEFESGFTALRLAKECRAELEAGMAIDPASEQGYAYGILGTLYAHVPGWPLGFGDKKKADALMQKGLEIAPGGMNINYFYAKFLYEQRDLVRARLYIDRAESAQPPYPPQESLPVAIRQREIRELSEKIKSQSN